MELAEKGVEAAPVKALEAVMVTRGMVSGKEVEKVVEVVLRIQGRQKVREAEMGRGEAGMGAG
jgi:hypothetical protein